MPPEMREQSELYGVEIDSLSARLSKQLHQNSHSRKGFEETLFTENSLDVVVANVPFADIRLTDTKHSKSITFMIILLNVPLTLYMKVGLSQSLPLLEQWIKGRVFS